MIAKGARIFKVTQNFKKDRMQSQQRLILHDFMVLYLVLHQLFAFSVISSRSSATRSLILYRYCYLVLQYSGTPLIRPPMGQRNLAVIAGGHINGVGSNFMI